MKIQEALAGVTTLAIETAPFIYFVERHRQTERAFTTFLLALIAVTSAWSLQLSRTLRCWYDR